MKNIGKMKSQRGFAIGVVLAVIALIAVVAGAISIASRGSGAGGSTATQQNSANASMVRYQGAQLETAFEKMMARGVVNTSITFDTAVTTGLFNATSGASNAQVPPSTAFVTMPVITNPQDPWLFSNSGISLLGSTQTAAIKLPGLTQAVCAALNNLIAGSTAIPTTTNGGGMGGEVCYNDGTTGYTYVRGIY